MTTVMRAAMAAPRSLRRFFCTNSTQVSPTTDLYISGLSKRTTPEKLKEKFSEFGEVVHARVATDRASGYSKGFGFVKYSTIEGATKGIEGMDGKFLDGWVVFAEYVTPEIVKNVTGKEERV